MRQPRIYIKNGKFYVGYYIAGNKFEQRKSTEIRADIPFVVGEPEWWKKSKAHKAELERFIETAIVDRSNYRRGIPSVIDEYDSVPSLLALLDMLAKQWERRHDQKMERSTIYKYKTSIGVLQRYNKHLGLLNTSDEDGQRFKQWLQKKGYEQSTIEGYIRRLKSLWKFAIEQGLIRYTPWKEVFVRVEPKLIIPFPLDDEKQFFRAAWRTNRPIFYFAFFQRMTGYRFSDTAPITAEMIQGDTIYWRNVKMKRPDAYPICPALRYAVDLMNVSKGRFFPKINSTQKYNVPLAEICEVAGVQKLTSKSFKPNFGQELDAWLINGRSIEDRFMAALMHHKIKGVTAMSSRHYIQHLPQMQSILTDVLSHWYDFIVELATEDK